MNYFDQNAMELCKEPIASKGADGWHELTCVDDDGVTLVPLSDAKNSRRFSWEEFFDSVAPDGLCLLGLEHPFNPDDYKDEILELATERGVNIAGGWFHPGGAYANLEALVSKVGCDTEGGILSYRLEQLVIAGRLMKVRQGFRISYHLPGRYGQA
ncbi:MAG: hypothetical protein QNK18_04340 [Gammaproteobacteria bacterium]|nr:hypothetical protein [Gammaproteobacteria bacterium]MDJ0890408.1 hypothetical protein [Gammaproteobacteria bacterium]